MPAPKAALQKRLEVPKGGESKHGGRWFGADFHLDRLRQELPDVRSAVQQAAQDRLRPILMTSATTVLALLPMAVGVGEGAELRAPMAIAVIGGLITSTLMTLVLIPVVYETVERLRRRRA